MLKEGKLSPDNDEIQGGIKSYIKNCKTVLFELPFDL